MGFGAMAKMAAKAAAKQAKAVAKNAAKEVAADIKGAAKTAAKQQLNKAKAAAVGAATNQITRATGALNQAQARAAEDWCCSDRRPSWSPCDGWPPWR